MNMMGLSGRRLCIWRMGKYDCWEGGHKHKERQIDVGRHNGFTGFDARACVYML